MTTCAITGNILTGLGAPAVGYDVRTYPVAPTTGVVPPYPANATDNSGNWSVALTQGETWRIHLPLTELEYQGVVPVLTTVTLPTLIASHGWTLVPDTDRVQPIYTSQVGGPQGQPGAAGVLKSRGVWSNSTAYAINDAVAYDNGSGTSYYVAMVANLGQQPDTHAGSWALYASQGGPGPKGDAGPPGPTYALPDATVSTTGGVEVDHAPSGSHPVALTTDGTTMPAGLLGTSGTTAAAGNDSRLTNSRTPSGSAGGDLTGTYPNPTLGASGATPATYGDGTHVSQVTVDAKGRVTTAASIPIGQSSLVSKTANYTILSADHRATFVVNAASVVLTLPAPGTAGNGFEITIKNNNQTTTGVLTNTSGVTIDGTDYSAAAFTIGLTSPYGAVTLRSDGTHWYSVVLERPIATASSLGDVKVGSGLSVAADGTLSSAAAGGTVSAKSANYTIGSSDNGNTIAAAAASLVFTLPSPGAMGNGFSVVIKNENQTTTSVKTNTAGVLIDGVDCSTTGFTTGLTAAYGAVKIQTDGTNWFTIAGDGSGSGGSAPSHTYFTKLAAFLEPDAIEPVQIGTFSYVVAGGVTKHILLGWSLQIGGAGRFEIRDPRKPMPLRGVTVSGIQAASVAAILDTTKPTYADAWTTYYDRMDSIEMLATKVVNITAASQTLPFLPGAYGAIITSINSFNLDWVAVGAPNNSNFPLDYELGDAAGDYIRFAHTMTLPINKATVCRAISGLSGGAGGDAPGGEITYVLLPSTWSKVTDALAPYTFREDFMGATLDDTTIWNRTQSTAGNVEIDTTFGWCKAIGNNSWGANGAYTRTSFARSGQPHLLVDVFVPLNATAGSPPNVVIGWFDRGGYSYANAAHGVDFSNNGAGSVALVAFENGTSRGVVGSGWTAGCVYRLRLTIQSGGGCTYEIQGGPEYPAIGGTSWTTITPGTTTSATNTLSPGFTQLSSGLTTYVSDVRVY